jgi:hypothetical protein
MSRSRRPARALVLALVSTLLVVACAQLPTVPNAATVRQPAPGPAHHDDTPVDSLTCLNGYNVTNGIVTCK